MSSSKPYGLSNHSISSGGEGSSEPIGYQDWHARFNQGIGEFLNSWSVFSPFRRRTSKRQATDSSEKISNEKDSIHSEHIELVHFPNPKAPESLWENMHGKIATPGDVPASNNPVMVSPKPHGSRSKEKAAVDLTSQKEESICAVSLKKLAAFLWEEPDDGQGAGHDFVYSHSSNPTWCDKCGDLLWGIYQAKYMRCQYPMLSWCMAFMKAVWVLHRVKLSIAAESRQALKMMDDSTIETSAAMQNLTQGSTRTAFTNSNVILNMLVWNNDLLVIHSW